MQTSKFKWLDRNEYPFKSNFLSHGNVQQHYIDEGSGEVILFVHGTPSWSFDFRNIIKDLAKNYRCLAIDHIGFGLSDKPKDYPYGVIQHAVNLETFIQQKQLNNITLVLHDFGGPIGLAYAQKHSENIKRIIIMNSWTGSSELDPEFLKLKRVLKSPLLPFLYLNLNFSARFLLPQSFGKRRPSSKLLKQYSQAFANKSDRFGALAFARSLLNDQDLFEQQKQDCSVLIDKPILFIWGMKDTFAGPRYLKRFQELFTKAETIELETCGHFPQEEEAEAVIDSLKKFLA